MFHIRHAAIADAEAILQVHGAAVRGTAASWYPADVIEAWTAKITEDSRETVRLEINDPAMIVVVAEAEGQVVGFGMVMPANEELRAVYVHAEHGGQGVGGAILQNLEALAIKAGVKQLQLDASLNAEAFYAKHGYQVVERAVHRFRSGHEMACVMMAKLLTVPVSYRDG